MKSPMVAATKPRHQDTTQKAIVPCQVVVGAIALAKLIACVNRLFFSHRADQGRSYQSAVEHTQKRSTQNSNDAEHVERMHQNIVVRLEAQHKVKSARNAQGQAF